MCLRRIATICTYNTPISPNFIILTFIRGRLSDTERERLIERFDVAKRSAPRIDLVIYVHTQPETSFGRMQRRGRIEEASVPLSYIKAIHRKHLTWLFETPAEYATVPILLVDGERTGASSDALRTRILNFLQIISDVTPYTRNLATVINVMNEEAIRQ